MEAQTLITGGYSEALAYADSMRESVLNRRASDVAPAATPSAAPTMEAQNKPVLLVDTHFRIRSANRLLCERFGISPTISNGAFLFRVGNGQWDQRDVRAMLIEVITGDGRGECTVEMDLPRLGHCRIRLTAERRANYRPLDLIAITVEECLVTVTESDQESAPDADTVRLSRSVMSVSRGLYRELALIIGCAQTVLESGDAEARKSAAEIIAAANQIQGSHSQLLLQARALSQQVPVELVTRVIGTESAVNTDDSITRCARIAREQAETALLNAA